MKKTVLSLTLMLCSGAFSGAQPYVPQEGQIPFEIWQTSGTREKHQVLSTPFSPHAYSRFKCIDLDAAQPSHPFEGLGVSMTDASCWLISRMEPAARKAFLKDAFGPEGMGISLIRLNCGASDYATELYNYDDTPGDTEMKHFSIDRDRLYMIPVLKEALAARPDMYVFSSIWSVPGWMKTSGQMCGGSLKDEYLPAFANYWAAYLKAYKAAGVPVDAITVQNEPLTDQGGGCPACFVSQNQEAKLASVYLPRAFKKAGLKTDIWIFDHNYKYYQRVLDQLSDPEVRKSVGGVAWHPYSGEASQMRAVFEKYPEIPMHLTERGPNKKHDQPVHWWADVVFGALNNGCRSYSSWNLLLDEDGQPVTGRFYCAGLEEVDSVTGKIFQSTQSLLFRQIGPYVQRGAQILKTEQPDGDVRMIAFRNPDGRHVLVFSALASSDRQKIQIKLNGQYLCLSLPLNTWSVTTVVIG